ncbi:MAG: choice-of-anchor H family protein [Gammaproteobacteria bacterium]
MLTKSLRDQTSHTGNARFRRDVGAIAIGLLIASLTLGTQAQTFEDVTIAAETTSSTEARVATSRGFTSNERSVTGKTAPVETASTKPRSMAKDAPGKSFVAKSSFFSDFEIYDAQVALYFDDDLDGFFYGIDVNFDADTEYSTADVYARLYLSLEGGPWELYYTTEVFTIFGDSGSDDYTVETELYSGYPPAFYDVLIELYDYDTGDFVAEFGPEDSLEMRDAPLEDQQKDIGIITVGPEPIISRSSGGGGSTSVFSLAFIALVLLTRRIRQSTRLESPTHV